MADGKIAEGDPLSTDIFTKSTSSFVLIVPFKEWLPILIADSNNETETCLKKGFYIEEGTACNQFKTNEEPIATLLKTRLVLKLITSERRVHSMKITLLICHNFPQGYKEYGETSLDGVYCDLYPWYRISKLFEMDGIEIKNDFSVITNTIMACNL